LPKRYRRLRARHRKFAPHCPNSANRQNTAETEQDARERDRKAANDRDALETNRNIIIIVGVTGNQEGVVSEIDV
jgi:hypothetical protein